MREPCGHAVLKPSCTYCIALQRLWYAKLNRDPEWRDIEYGLEQPPFVYQPVDIKSIDQSSTDYYDLIWSIHHAWVATGRSKRDCLIAELLAKQEGETGTKRGIAAVLKARGFKRCSETSVFRVVTEIDRLSLGRVRTTGVLIVEQGFKPSTTGLQTAQGRSQWPKSSKRTVLRRTNQQNPKAPSTPTESSACPPTSTRDLD